MPADQPTRSRESISVLRLTPNVRQTAALVAPLLSAAITAASFSASITTGRPPRRPRRRAAARPALTRSWVRERSNCAVCGAPHTAEFERVMIRERTSAGLAAARAEGRIGGRRKKLDDAKRREIAEAVISGRKTAAQMARMFGVSQPTVSRIVAAHVAGHA
jgi:hypothetical protein